MNKLKSQGFWLGVAAAIALLVVGFVVLVVPLWARQTTHQRAVKGLASTLEKKKMVGSPDIQAARDYREKMVKEYGDIVKFYSESDEHLERWFEPSWNNDPPRDTFMAKLRGEIQRIEKELADKGTEVGLPDPNNPEKRLFGFNWEDLKTEHWPQIGADEKRVLKELQKRFWARQRVADVILKSREPIKVTRVHDFHFARPLHERLTQNATWEAFPLGADAAPYPGFTDPSGQRNRQFQEYDLPNELGRTTTFGFALQLPYSEVPKVIREILQPGGEGTGDTGKGRLLVNILGAQVTIRQQNAPLRTFSYYKGDDEDKKKKLDEIMKDVKARDVLLLVTCQIVDFDSSKAKKFEGAPEAK
jgi:hypothetical protein